MILLSRQGKAKAKQRTKTATGNSRNTVVKTFLNLETYLRSTMPYAL
ncbi:MAG: hypothetical protein ACFCU5_01185 [Pleurocapsa sp.]